MSRLTVGFDLDMTLIDSRPGISRVWEALAAETGADIDVAAAVSRLGPPLDHELALWFPSGEVESMGERFRALYPDHAVLPTVALPGAAEALAAVRGHGGRSVVVTAKFEPNARLHIEHLELDADEVVGWLWGAAKAEALIEHGASVYVGDHVYDVLGAKAAGAVSVAVATGPCSAADLQAAGADVVLPDLTAFPQWLKEHLLAVRLEALETQLRSLGGLMVAFSGGADSAFLLAAAVRALGADHVVAATAISDSLARQELRPAADFAHRLGVRHLTPQTHEMDRAGYRANDGDRCYFCKAELLDVLVPLAAEHDIAHIATGTNADDAIAGFRPGIRAAVERGAVTPLRDAELSKAQIREASRRWGLPTWDKPAAACLSSRVAYGITITPHRLGRIDRAEAGLRRVLAAAGIPVTNLRVRDLGDRARVEVDGHLRDRVAGHPPALDAVKDAGFATVEVDRRGFRSGSMNELLPQPGRFR